MPAEFQRLAVTILYIGEKNKRKKKKELIGIPLKKDYSFLRRCCVNITLTTIFWMYFHHPADFNSFLKEQCHSKATFLRNYVFNWNKSALTTAEFSVIVWYPEKQTSPQRIMNQHLFFLSIPFLVLLVAGRIFIWGCSNNAVPTLSWM